MAKIKRRQRIRVEELLESGFAKQERPRKYLGCSQIGGFCQRKVWYQFRWFKMEDFTHRQKRLFARGHNEEPYIHADLKKIGVKIISKQEGASTAEGHIKGHNDGILTNVPNDKKKTKYLNEIKTANEKSFNSLLRCRNKAENQVAINLWNMAYYVQVILYMYLFKLKKCLYIVVNKNDDQRFYEIIKADTEQAEYWLNKAVDLINRKTPPDRIGNSTFYYCKNFKCNYYLICHCGKNPDKNCRTCKALEAVEKGKWRCKKKKKNISFKKQQKACKRYQMIRD